MSAELSEGEPSPTPQAERDLAAWLLAILLTALVVVDLAVLVVPPGGSVSVPVRAGLAALAFLAVGVAVVVGTARSPRSGAGAALALPAAVVYAYTGLLLPWTQTSFLVGRTLVEFSLSVPVVGESLARALVGGTSLSAATLRTAFRYHYAVVVGVGVGLLVVFGRTAWSRRDALTA